MITDLFVGIARENGQPKALKNNGFWYDCNMKIPFSVSRISGFNSKIITEFQKRVFFCIFNPPKKYPRRVSKVSFRKIFSDKNRMVPSIFLPIIASEITGLKISKTGKEIKDILLAFPLAKQMLEERELAKRIIQAIKLAEKKEQKYRIRALTSSVTKEGLIWLIE